MGLLPFVKDRITFLFFDQNDILVDALEVEATLGAQHKRSARVSRHPVAKGEATTDNVRPDPNGLTLDCFWGDRASDPILFGTRYAKAQFQESGRAYNTLNQMFTKAYRITINMRLWTYENMVIQDMSHAETVEDGNSIKISITFTEIKTVSSSTVPQVKATPVKKGPVAKQAVKPKPAANPPQKASMLAKGADASSGFGTNTTLWKKP